MNFANADNKEFIRKLTEIVHQNLGNENFGVKELVQKSGLNRTFLNRKLHAACNQSISQFIREIRLKRAYEMLQEGNITASEVAYEVGFGSPAYFNTCFHEYYGISPGEVRKKVVKGIEENIIQPDEPQKPTIQDRTGFSAQKNNFRRIISFAAVVIFLVFTGYMLLNTLFRQSNSLKGIHLNKQEKSIAVLPFKNLGGDKENQYFADGVMEDILTNLSYIKEFKVISRTSAEEFRESTLNMHEISKKLGVNYVMEGSVQKYGEKVRVRIQFIDARRDIHLFSETFDRDLSDIFAIQSDIAQKVASLLQTKLSSEEVFKIQQMPTQNIEAYKLYQMGRFFWNRRNKADQLKSIEYFEKALVADPDYALAYAGLADAYYILTWWKWYPRPEGYNKAKELALKALELDNHLAEAHATLGGILSYGEWKWEEARKELKLAIEINPNYATGHHYYAEFLDIINDREGCRTSINRACELDPYSYIINALSGHYFFNEGRFEKALESFNRAYEIDPEKYKITWSYYFQIFKSQQNELKAVEAFRKSLANDPVSGKYLNEVNSIYNRSGLNGVLKFSIEIELSKNNADPWIVGNRYAILGEKDEALKWFEKAVNEKEPRIPRINSDPTYVKLHAEPRFQALIRKMGLEDYPMK